MPKINLQNIKIKLQEVYLPFLVVSLATVLIYTFLRWLTDIKFGILPLKKDLLDFWIPVVLPWVPIQIWMRRRIRVLNVQGKNNNGYFFYQLVIVGTIFITLLNAQKYITTNSYDLNDIKSIEDIDGMKGEKYFKVSSFLVEKDSHTAYTSVRTSGRSNENLNIALFIAVPFEKSQTIWYGIEYNSRMSNHLPEAEKNRTYRRFIDTWEVQYENHNFYGTRYFEKVGLSDEFDGYVNAIQLRNPNLQRSDLTVLIPHKDAFTERVGNSLEWAFGSFAIGSLIFLIMVLVPSININELKLLKSGKPSKDDDLKDILRFLNPVGKYRGTAILVWTNIFVFGVIMVVGVNFISPTGQELLEVGGNRKLEVFNGAYWRLFTSVFVHAGIVHLFVNLFGIGVAGYLLENKVSHFWLIVVYMVCGTLASLVSVYYNDNIVSVGGSGAIFGLFGVILSFAVFKVYKSEIRKFIWWVLISYAGINLLLGTLMKGIDNAAHFGGVIAGFFIGYLIKLIISKETIDL